MAKKEALMTPLDLIGSDWEEASEASAVRFVINSDGEDSKANLEQQTVIIH